MQHPLERQRLFRRIETCLREAPVTVLLGARQVGKTTLARMLAGKRDATTFFDLESMADQRALSTPELTLKECRGLVVLDEVQRMPNLFTTLRPLADRPNRPATFLLLGSASPTLVKGVSESLAGRVLSVEIPGFSVEEVGPRRLNDLWLRGGYPRSFLEGKVASRERWMDAFLSSLWERDVPQLGLRVSASALQRFWLTLAHYHAQVWNASELARAMDVTPKTAQYYLDILEGLYVVRVLKPWHENIKKRQVKSPKVYIRDSGLFHRMVGVETTGQLSAHPKRGASWEGFALEQTLIRWGGKDAYYWATQRGAELDLMLVRKGKRFGVEFKCTGAPELTRSMRMALEDLDLARLYVVYPGSRRYPLHEKVTVPPISDLPKTDLER